ncbi:wax ester/triacylglycerol synthase domain-containing protein [Agromyces sp. NPDC057865]|uniref:wax ester/triacylglycerol synthase domain-containing protein n=1 Tax=Agromyces sp. NPDC057865 TaxID=3346267 RepID=UPI00366F02C9
MGSEAAERISPIDAATLGISVHGGQPYFITLAGVLGPGEHVDVAGRPDAAAIRRLLAGRIGAVRGLAQRAALRDGAWWWEPRDPDLAAHVRVEEPGPGARGFEAVCGRLLMRPLPPDRPLWEIVLVPGARPGGCGIVIRFHHVIADGAHAVALVEGLFDPAEDDSAKPPGGPAASPTAAPAAAPAAAPSTAPTAPPSRRPSRTAVLAYRIHQFVRPWIRSRTLLGPLGPRRDAAGASVDLERLHHAAHAAGGTIGDAFLAAVGRGLAHAMRAAGERVPATITVSQPVRLASRDGQLNSVGVMIVPVPLGGTMPDAMRRIARTTTAAKPVARAAGTVIRSPRAARGFDAFARHQHLIAAVVSNVPGPSRRLALAGSPLVELLPLGPLAGNVRIGVTAASYDGRFWLAVVTDADHVIGAAEVADRIAGALDELGA